MSIIREIARMFVSQEGYGTYQPPSLKHPKKHYLWHEGPIPDGDIAMLEARATDFARSVRLELADKVRACVFDIDDHDGILGDQPREAAEVIARKLVENGYRPLVCSSGGGRGFHIWLFLKTPRRKDAVRGFMRKVIEGQGFEEGNGLENGMIELFPKAGKGTPVALPYALDSEPFELLDDQLVHATEKPSQVPISEPLKPGRKSHASKAVDAEDAFRHFVKGKNGGDYDIWVRVGLPTKAALGDEGFDLWDRWSSAFDGYDGTEATREKWDTGLRNPKSPDVFWKVARANGYSGGLPDGIEFAKKDAEKASLIELVADMPAVLTPEGRVFVEIEPRSWESAYSTAVQRHIRRIAHRAGHDLLSNDMLKALGGHLDASAQDIEEVFVRSARQDGRVFYAVADDNHTVLELTPQGPLNCEHPPVRFKRGECLPAPIDDSGSLDDLRAVVNVDDDNLLLLVAYLAKALAYPDSGHPLLMLAGEAGSLKSSTMTTIVLAVDPKPCVLAAPPRTEDDLIVAASENYLLSYDNLSKIGGLSDALCRLATGGGLKKRKLYTDGETFTLDVKRPVLMTGIDPEAMNPDLVQRMVRLELSPPILRMTDSQVQAIRAARLPAIRRYLLGVACRVLARPLPVIAEPVIRMVDFAAVGELVAQNEFGKEAGWFERFYAEMLREAADVEAQGDLVLEGILMLCANAPDNLIRGNGESLLRLIHDEVGQERGKIFGDQSLLPKTARGLASRITKAMPALRGKGFTVEQDGRRVWTISGVRDEDRVIPF